MAASAWPKGIGRAGWFSLAPRPIYLPMPLDLTDDEKAALIELLLGTIDRDRFPLSPGSGQLRVILARLAPEPPRPSAQPSHTSKR